MKTLKMVFRELAGLFVDDGALAFEIVAVVMLAAISRPTFPNMPMMTGGILLFGCLAVLLMNVWRARNR